MLGVGGDGNLDWRAEQDAAGEIVMYFGPGVVDLPLNDTTVKVAASSDAALADLAAAEDVPKPAASNPVAAANWVCQMEEPATPELTGGNLKSFVGVSCTSRPGSMLVQYKYQRSSWSGMRNYTNVLQTFETTLQALGANTYTPCGSGGTYDYNVTAHAVVYNAGAV